MRRFSRVNRVLSSRTVHRDVSDTMGGSRSTTDKEKRSLRRTNKQVRVSSQWERTKKKKKYSASRSFETVQVREQKDYGWAESSTRSPLTRRRWQTIGAQEAEPDLWAGREGCVSSRTQAFCTCTYLLIRVYIHPSRSPFLFLSLYRRTVYVHRLAKLFQHL